MTDRVDILNELAFHLRSYKGLKNRLYADSAYTLAEKIGYKAGLARAMNIKSMKYASLAKYDSLILLNQEALQVAKESADDFVLSKIYNTLAYAHYQSLEHDTSLEYYQSALHHTLEGKDTTTMSVVLGNLVRLHLDQKNYETARTYLEQLGDIGSELNDPNILYTVQYRYGTLNLFLEEWTKAADHFNQALDLARQLKQRSKRQSINLFLAEVYCQSGKYELAENHIQKVYSLYDNKPSEAILKRIRLWESNLAKERKNYYLAIEKAQEGLRISQERNSQRYILLFMESIIECEEALGNYKSAFIALGELRVFQDSLNKDDRSKKILELETKYQAEKKGIENQLLLEQTEKDATELKQRRTLNLAGGVTGLLSTFLAFLFWRYFQREKDYSENLETKVKERTEKIEKSNEELERFAYITSHDLKEPIRNIRNFSQLIKAKLGVQAAETKEYFDIIERSTEQMQDLVDGILDYSTLNSLENLEHVSLNKIVNDVISYLGNNVSEKNAAIKAEVLPTIRCNPIQVFQVFKNLIENGLKYNNSIQPLIRIEADKSDEHKVVLVSDNGIGIDPAFSDSIFNMFSRLHDRSKYKGAGLGLSIVKKLMEESGGDIKLLDSSKSGSTFALYFPNS